MLFVLACASPDTDSAPPVVMEDEDPPVREGAPFDPPSWSEGAVPERECTEMSSGLDWAFDGLCPMMLTPCEIEVDRCSLTIGYSSGMDMGMPYAGGINGRIVTFRDGAAVTGCVGELVGPDEVVGACDGCTFTLVR